MNAFISIVMPCLNEEDTLASTCQSLGFRGDARPPQDCILVLVDNGSIDATASVARRIQADAPRGAVVLAVEPERGYVPPRRRGNRVAYEEARARGISTEELLIVQVDADTTYSPGYSDALRQSAVAAGRGAIIEARSDWPFEFLEAHADYVEMCNEIDEEFQEVLSGMPDDVVIDDKACAYWWGDYEMWGGHRREYTSAGDEILSETTRLYIRAHSRGAIRDLCEDAVACHSSRRVLSEPSLSFATAGFPREAGFVAGWQHHYRGPNDIREFASKSNRSSVRFALACRRAHLRGLFQVLPTEVRRAIEHDPEVARERPGLLLESVFRQIDSEIFNPMPRSA